MGKRRPPQRPAPAPPGSGDDLPGLVLAHHGQTSLVETASGDIIRCATRKNLPRTLCGDRVLWRPGAARQGIITAVLDRSTTLVRPDPHSRPRPVASNLDQIVVVIATKPSFEYGMLDRYLAAAELIGATPVIVVNKSDLLNAESRDKLEQRLEPYRRIGYAVLFTSTRSTDGLMAVHRQLQSHTSILVGQSGVGKSSLVQALLPDQDIRIGALSELSGLGKHTTTVTMLYHLPGGGDLIDSPGVRDFTLSAVPIDQLQKGFREFGHYAGRCRFHNCRHLSEPGCAVQDAVRGGLISERRLENYRELAQALASAN